jgi:hypothetical protein
VIASDLKGSKLNDLKKNCEVNIISEIAPSVIKSWILSFDKNISQSNLNTLIKTCKSDKRLILNALDFLKHSGGYIDSFLENYYKDVDINLVEFTKKVFDISENVDTNTVFIMYDTDGFSLSNLIHENYLDYNTDIDNIAKAADALSYGEILFSDTYESSKTFLPEHHCLNSILLPSFYAKNDIPTKTMPRSSVINNRFNILLNNKKILSKINTQLVHPFVIYDIYTIKSILNKELIKSKVNNDSKIEFIKNISRTLGGNTETLELIYKHFNDFKEQNAKEVKTKNFTQKFKEKIKVH